MGKEDFVQGHGDNGHTTHRNSFIRRLQSLSDQLRARRTIANETDHVGGFHRSEIPFAGTSEQRRLMFPDEYRNGESEEIVLFDPNVRECLDTRTFDFEDRRLKPD